MRTRSIKKTPIKVTVKAETKELEIIDSPLVSMIKAKQLPEDLAQMMQTWKKLGNKWYSCMEAQMMLESTGLRTENILAIPAARCLVYMGFMSDQKGDYRDCWVTRYKLTKTGLKALGLDPHEINALETGTQAAEGECEACGGIGVDDDGDPCTDCKGTGTVSTKKTKAVTIKSLPEKRSAEPKPVIVKVDCPKCDGTGVYGNGKICMLCSGTGEIIKGIIPTKTPVRSKIKVKRG